VLHGRVPLEQVTTLRPRGLFFLDSRLTAPRYLLMISRFSSPLFHSIGRNRQFAFFLDHPPPLPKVASPLSQRRFGSHFRPSQGRLPTSYRSSGKCFVEILLCRAQPSNPFRKDEAYPRFFLLLSSLQLIQLSSFYILTRSLCLVFSSSFFPIRTFFLLNLDEYSRIELHLPSPLGPFPDAKSRFRDKLTFAPF